MSYIQIYSTEEILNIVLTFLKIVIPFKTNNSKWLLDKNINDQIRF